MDSLNEEKQFYERFWSLLNDKDLMMVFEKYGPMAFRRSSVLEGLEKFIQENGFKGKTCIEIGSLKGLTAIVLSRYFDRVITIDIIDDRLKYEIADLLGVNNVVFINVRNNDEKTELVKSLTFDAAYVDGDHTHDTQSDFDLVKHCGKVLFHEFWDAQPSVKELVNSLGNIQHSGKFALWTN